MNPSSEVVVARLRTAIQEARLPIWVSPPVVHPVQEESQLSLERGDISHVEVTGADRELAEWKKILPGESWLRGGLTEWFAQREGDGAGTVAMMMASRMIAESCFQGEQMRKRGWLVVIDPEGSFYPPGVLPCGISLEHLVVVRVERPKDVVWAWEQALRCVAVGVVWGHIARIGAKEFRRLQLAAEQGGGMGMLVRDACWRAEPSWAELGVLVSPIREEQSRWGERRWKLEVVRCRGGQGVGRVIVVKARQA